MKRFLALVLMLILNLSITGIVFAQDTLTSDENLPPCVREDESANAGGVLIGDRGGVLIGDRKGVLIGDRIGVLIGDFYEWIFGESDETNCKN